MNDLPRPAAGSLGVSTRTRLLVSAVLGLAAGILVGVLLSWQLGLMSGWMLLSATFLVWTWVRITGMDAGTTAAHALREDPGRRTFSVLVLSAAVASLVGVVLLLADDNSPGGKALQAGISITSIFLSWGLIQTVFTQRYAELYYVGSDGGVDFNGGEKPDYKDFAYLAFTIGMTYQVSDTDLTDRAIRHTALRQGLLSYLFGAVIIAATINLIGGFAGK